MYCQRVKDVGIIEAAVIIDAPVSDVWNVVSDLDAEPKFWRGTKEVRNISSSGNRIRREIVIAFRNKKCIQEIVLDPPQNIKAEFVDGIIRGTKNISLDPVPEGCKLIVSWNIRLGGMAGMFGGMVKGHIKKGTKQALDLIKKEVESRRSL